MLSETELWATSLPGTCSTFASARMLSRDLGKKLHIKSGYNIQHSNNKTNKWYHLTETVCDSGTKCSSSMDKGLGVQLLFNENGLQYYLFVIAYLCQTRGGTMPTFVCYRLSLCNIHGCIVTEVFMHT